MAAAPAPWAGFTWSEVRCHATGRYPPSAMLQCSQFGLLVSMINRIRRKRPLRVTSWYRDPDHPLESAKPHPGAHSTGLAADIAVHGDRAIQAVREGVCEAHGVGVQQAGPLEDRYVHLDFAAANPNRGLNPVRPVCFRRGRLLPVELTRPAIWSY